MDQEKEALPLEFFSDEQRLYLDQLTKFAGRTNRTRIATSQEMPSKKYETFLIQNLALMTIDEQCELNNAQSRLKQHRSISYVVAGAMSFCVMAYFVITKPLQQKLYFEVFKSGLLGGGLGIAHYQYGNYKFREEMHVLYIKLLNRKKLGKV